MREEDEIRAAVIALAEAQAAGEDVADALPHGAGAVSGPGGAAGSEAAGEPASAAGSAAAGLAAPPLFAEGDDPGLQRETALTAVFDGVRAATRRGRLSRPAEWEAAGRVPPSMTPEDLEMAVYDCLVQAGVLDAHCPAAEGAAAAAAVRRPANNHVKSAFSSSNGRAVGAPPFKRKPAAAVPLREERALEPSGEPREAPLEERTPTAASPSSEAVGPHPFPACAGIRLLMGATSYYLYDSEAMTDAYARWAFLAAEDDPVATFVECVREESSLYPRPMAASSLANAPFSLDAAAVEAAYAAARAQGRADDIERIEASNGNVYFHSTRFLSPARAVALAEWDAVERRRNV